MRRPDLSPRLSARSGLTAISLFAALTSVTWGCGDGSTHTRRLTSDDGEGGGGGQGGGQACVPETEMCDGLDNNCNMTVDEGCSCTPEATQPCYTGAPATRGVGECKDGAQTCGAESTWGACMGDVLPSTDTCDGLDNDCNGGIDDGISQQTCGEGACKVTVPGCDGGQVPVCEPGQPSFDVCDGIDNDCNAMVDDGIPQETCGEGACKVTVPGCTNGQVPVCTPGQPTSEKCDGVDNNCNGAVDDGIAQQTCGVGACKVTVSGCLNGQVPACTPGQASAETCDGIDNNCNGAVDDGIAPKTCGVGACKVTVAGCLNGQVTVCTPGQPSFETCDNIDNDCNGVVDDGIADQVCGFGLCETIVPGCLNGFVPACVPGVGSLEVCDGSDNDCNGLTDEGNPGGGASCSTGLAGVCASGTTTCDFGFLSCVQDTQASDEICGNAIDEDCDGLAPGAPTVYFSETFADNSKGWTLGNEWAIGPAVASLCGGASVGDDPASDHSPTADNGVAGVILGGCYSTVVHSDYCITSPAINTTVAPANVFLSFWRHLHTDYPSYIDSRVDVSADGGGFWTTVYAVPSGEFQDDADWTLASFDVTAMKSATFKVRFCYSAGQSGIIAGGGWNVDDVQLSDAVCQ